MGRLGSSKWQTMGLIGPTSMHECWNFFEKESENKQPCIHAQKLNFLMSFNNMSFLSKLLKAFEIFFSIVLLRSFSGTHVMHDYSVFNGYKVSSLGLDS